MDHNDALALIVNIGFDGKESFEQTATGIRTMFARLSEAGLSFVDSIEIIQEKLDDLAKQHGPEVGEKLADAFKQARAEILKEIAKAGAEAGVGLTKAVTAPLGAFKFISSSGVNVGSLLASVARARPAMKGFVDAFSNVKAMWDFAEGIANVNSNILQLHFTSGMGVEALTSLGDAASAFGGSAQTVASGQERFTMQMEAMKRGGGMGQFGNVAFKYGFMTDLNADYQTNTRAAIEHASTMSPTEMRAFLKEWDPSRYAENVAMAEMDKGRRDEYYSFFDRAANWGDAEAAARATQDYNMEIAKLKRTWQGVTNQVASDLLPVLQTAASWARGFADVLRRAPAPLRIAVAGLGSLAVVGKGLIGTMLQFKTAINIATIAKRQNAVATEAEAAAKGVNTAATRAESSAKVVNASATRAEAASKGFGSVLGGLGARGIGGALGKIALPLFAAGAVATLVVQLYNTYKDLNKDKLGDAVSGRPSGAIDRTISPDVKAKLDAMDSSTRAMALSSFDNFLKAVTKSAKDNANEVSKIPSNMHDLGAAMRDYEAAKFGMISNSVNNNQRSLSIVNNISTSSTGNAIMDAQIMADTISDSARNLGVH